MQLPEKQFRGLAPWPALAILVRALQRALPALWQATRSAPPQLPAQAEVCALAELVAELGLRALNSDASFASNLSQSELELVHAARSAAGAMENWVHRSEGLPEAERRAWRGAAGAARVVARVAGGELQFLAEVELEGLEDACQALAVFGRQRADSARFAARALRAVRADLALLLRLGQGRHFDPRPLLDAPLWGELEPAGEAWSFAQRMLREQQASTAGAPSDWGRALEPPSSGARAGAGERASNAALRRCMTWLLGLRRAFESTAPFGREQSRPSAAAEAASEAARAARKSQARGAGARRSASKSGPLAKAAESSEELRRLMKRAKPRGFGFLQSEGAALAARPFGKAAKLDIPAALGHAGLGQGGLGAARAAADRARARAHKAKAKAKTVRKAKAARPAARAPESVTARAARGGTVGAPRGGTSGEPRGGFVNTGFLSAQQPLEFLEQRVQLAAGEPHWFGVQIGELLEGVSAGGVARIDPARLPARARLSVALFGFEGEIELWPQAARGVLALDAQGFGSVVQQPIARLEPRQRARLPALPRTTAAWKQRLYFPVRLAPSGGRQRLRCNFYYRQTLLLSRVVTATAASSAARGKSRSARAAIAHVDDYRLARVFDAGVLRGFREHDLSLFLNDDGAGTHQLRIFGKQDVQQDVTLSAAQLEDLVQELRAALRTAAWAAPEEWEATRPLAFRYRGAQSRAMLEEDLATLARAGRRAYDVLRRPVDAALKAQDARLDALLASPVHIQFASRADPNELVPLALLYDRPLDPNLALATCPEFLRTLAAAEASADGARAIASSSCWQGACPSLGRRQVVCPSGFWGFRHYLGVPITLGEGAASSAASDLGCVGDPKLTVAVSVDASLPLREQHVSALRAAWPDAVVAETREATLQALEAGQSHVAYFYCHGDRVGPRKNVPALLVGPNASARIDASVISQLPPWSGPRPLVFLNGCHTTALLPSQSFGLVAAFVQDAQAAGVIGTEITVFEELASSFGLEFLRGLLAQSLELGVAMRRARLALLARKNPLGLAYVPFAPSRLKLRP